MKPTNIADLVGWVLIARTKNEHGKLDGGWYVCWPSTFKTKIAAEKFKRTYWTSGHRPRVVRGRLLAT